MVLVIMDDALALEALLELSQHLNKEEATQPNSTSFPLLDKKTVSSAVGAVSFIVEQKHKLQKQSVELLRKWCDIREAGLSNHWTWTGRGLDRFATMDCLLAACDTLLDQKSITKNWQCLELQQQKALCHALISVTSDCNRAKAMSIRLFELIISSPVFITRHQEFLNKIWNLREIVDLSIKQTELFVQNCPHSLEKELVEVAQDSVEKETFEPNTFWVQGKNKSLVDLCSSSPIIFQVATSIMMQLILKSQAHQNVIDMLTDFVAKCTLSEEQIIKLYPPKCQLALALLSVPPEATDCASYVNYLVDALHALQTSTARLLLILNKKWIPFVAEISKIYSLSEPNRHLNGFHSQFLKVISVEKKWHDTLNFIIQAFPCECLVKIYLKGAFHD